jgi:hypothetical protein
VVKAELGAALGSFIGLTGLSSIDHSIPAVEATVGAAQCAGFVGIPGHTGDVWVVYISAVTFFAGLQEAISARFQQALVAAVANYIVAIVAFLCRSQKAVAADGIDAHLTVANAQPTVKETLLALRNVVAGAHCARIHAFASGSRADHVRWAA